MDDKTGKMAIAVGGVAALGAFSYMKSGRGKDRSQRSEGLRIGVYMRDSKFKKMGFQEVVDYAKSKNVELAMVTLDKPLEEQGHLDAIITKMTDDLVLIGTDPKYQRRVDELERYLKAHPNVVDLEPSSNQTRVLDRERLCEVVDAIDKDLASDERVACPRYVVLDKDEADFTEALTKASIRFPVMCKTIQACGSAASHQMGVVFSEADLHRHGFEFPLLVQEFYSHRAVVFKVFVLGANILCVRRGSIKDLDSAEFECGVVFNSQDPFPDVLFDKSIDVKDKERLPNPPEEVLRIMAESIKRNLGLSLFGYDVITSASTGQHGIVDINFFPGYRGTPEFPRVFLEHLLERYETQKK